MEAETKLSRQEQLLVIIVSALIHFLLLILFLFLNYSPSTIIHKIFNQLPQETIPQQEKSANAPAQQAKEKDAQQQPQEQKEEWAEMLPGASQFGAPVIFSSQEDEYAYEGGTPESESTTQAVTAIDTLSDEPAEAETIVPPEDISIPTPIENTAPDTDTNPYNAADVSAHEKQEKIKDPEMVESTPPKKEKPVQKKKVLAKKQSKPFGMQKPPLTMAQLAHGFVDHMNNQGPHTVHMLGKQGAKPSLEQLKHERFLQKILWCLHNSFNIHRSKLPVKDMKSHVLEVYLQLNRNGQLEQLNIHKSSGISALDEFVLFVFNDASSAFPPVPQFIKDNPYKIIYVVEINAERSYNFKFAGT